MLLFAMPTFVVTILLPETYREDFLALVPEHRAVINRLLSEKVIETYAISAVRRRGWVTINGDDAGALRAIV